MNAKFDPSIREAFNGSKGIVDLEFDDETIQACSAEREAAIKRLEHGETTFEQEEARLLEQWRELKHKPKGAL